MYSATPQFDGDGPGLQPSPAVSANAAASPVTVYNDEQSKMAGMRAANAAVASMSAPKATSKPIDKSNWNKGIKVPQATVDAVKDAGRGNMGVNAATIANSKGSKYVGSQLMPNQPASPQYREAVTRVYPNAYNQAANKAASGRSNSPYGFGGYNPKTSIGGGSSASATK
jgi:hypothetical protein